MKDDFMMPGRWVVIFVFVVFFMVATTIHDLKQNVRLKDLEHKVETLERGARNDR